MSGAMQSGHGACGGLAGGMARRHSPRACRGRLWLPPGLSAAERDQRFCAGPGVGGVCQLRSSRGAADRSHDGAVSAAGTVLRVEAAALKVASTPPVVRMGSTIRLWLSSPVARIALYGTALENGAAGATIRVRVMPGGKVLDGTVRSVDSVELVAAGFDGAEQ